MKNIIKRTAAAQTLADGGSETIVAAVVPAGATVDAAGRITTVKAGTATITVAAKDGDKTATCTVTVNEQITMTTAKEGNLKIELTGSGEAIIANSK